MNNQRLLFTIILLAGILIVSHSFLNPNDVNQSATNTPAADFSINKDFKSASKQYRKQQEFDVNSIVDPIKPPLEPINPSPDNRIKDDPLKQTRLLDTRPLEESLRALQKLLQHEDPDIRLAAIEALNEINHPNIPNLLIAGLSDTVPLIRNRILNALSYYDDDSIISFIEPYLYDVDKRVRLTAIETLSGYKYPQSIEALAGLLSDGDTNIRHQAVVAMGEIEDERVSHYLEALAFDSNENIRLNAKAIIAENEDRL